MATKLPAFLRRSRRWKRKVFGPRKGDVLFTSGADWWNNARVQYGLDDLDLYAEGYKKAADIVARSVSRTRSSQDFLVYPVSFLYRHHLELMLKMIIRDGRRLLDKPNLPTNHHKLEPLWREARPLIEEVWPDDPRSDLDAAARLIDQFEKADPHSTAFRYHKDRDGNRSLPRGLSHINLRNLRQVVGRLSELLSGISCGFTYYLDIKDDTEDAQGGWGEGG